MKQEQGTIEKIRSLTSHTFKKLKAELPLNSQACERAWVNAMLSKIETLVMELLSELRDDRTAIDAHLDEFDCLVTRLEEQNARLRVELTDAQLVIESQNEQIVELRTINSGLSSRLLLLSHRLLAMLPVEHAQEAPSDSESSSELDNIESYISDSDSEDSEDASSLELSDSS